MYSNPIPNLAMFYNCKIYFKVCIFDTESGTKRALKAPTVKHCGLGFLWVPAHFTDFLRHFHSFALREADVYFESLAAHLPVAFIS